MRMFAYVVTHDTGFAPNPFGRYLTLACCKPAVRRVAAPGDIVVGLSPSQRGHRLVYAMRVAEKLPVAAYWRDRRFRAKRPRWRSADPVRRSGDNCYAPRVGTGFRQLASRHSHPDGREHAGMMARDLSGKYALVGRAFCYFGADAVALPPSLAFLAVGRGHRSRFTQVQVAAVAAFVEALPGGRRGWPRDLARVGGPGRGSCAPVRTGTRCV
jgi:hypothetical protein